MGRREPAVSVISTAASLRLSARRLIKHVFFRLRARTFVRPWGFGQPPVQLTATQEWFCRWNAERRSISIEESRGLFLTAWSWFPGGFAGEEFRSYAGLSQELYRLFWDDRPSEVYELYQFHGPLLFLRMLGYRESSWDASHPVLHGLTQGIPVTIVDFGCGLAQQSRGLAECLKSRGHVVHLVLVDVPTLRKDFLLWWGLQVGIAIEFRDCTSSNPLPALPSCVICFAVEVFEHLADPLPAFQVLHNALMPAGFLITSVGDHKAEFMHLSPVLAPVRQALRAAGYRELQPNRLFQKPRE